MNKTTLRNPDNVLIKKMLDLDILTEYETKTYIKLLEEGRIDARTLSIKAGIPRSKVYGTLKKLLEKGLIISINGKKREFIPKDPIKTLGPIQVYLRSRTRMFDEILEELKEKYEQRRTKPKIIEIFQIEKFNNIIKKIKELFAIAKNNILIISNEKHFEEIYRKTQKEFLKIERRGIDIKIKLDNIDNSRLYIKELKYIFPILEINQKINITIITVDNSKALLGKLKQKSDYNDEDIAIYFENPILINFLQEIIFLNINKRSYDNHGSFSKKIENMITDTPTPKI